MSPRQLGVLSALFDQIKKKIAEEEIDYSIAKQGLTNLLEGRSTAIYQPHGGLVLAKTFSVNSSRIERMTMGKDRWGRDIFEGYDEVTLRLGPFFTRVDSPSVEGGTCGVFETSGRMRPEECARELLKIQNGDISDLELALIDQGFSFSIRQVMEILKDKSVCKKNGVLFFVHNNEKTGVAVATIARTRRDLCGKDMNDPYAYAPGLQVVTRAIPSTVQK